MRGRNPWLLPRRRLLGWYVRFTKVSLPVAVGPAAGSTDGARSRTSGFERSAAGARTNVRRAAARAPRLDDQATRRQGTRRVIPTFESRVLALVPSGEPV